MFGLFFGRERVFLGKGKPERVRAPCRSTRSPILRYTESREESSCLGLQLEVGGKFHRRLNISRRPIANKYREGKMKRTLKRESKVPEIAETEAKKRSVDHIHLSFIMSCEKEIKGVYVLYPVRMTL